jgi:CRP/FNR family cyclic AMP-dependent transcriptional regulator
MDDIKEFRNSCRYASQPRCHQGVSEVYVTMLAINILKSVPLFIGTPDEHLAVLAHSSFRKYSGRGEFVVTAGDLPEALYVVMSGRAKVLLAGEGGHEVILAILGPNDYFGEMGLLDNQPIGASVRALERCEFVCIKREAFLRCMAGNFELVQRLTRGLAQRLSRANKQIRNLALMDTHERVASLLHDMAANVNGHCVVEKAPSKRDIAAMVGASREMVSRVMRELKRTGRIHVEKRRVILLDVVDDERPKKSYGSVPVATIAETRETVAHA